VCTWRRRQYESADKRTNDLMVSDIIRANELQVWFVAKHVVNVPLAQAV
jgi:starvation-inducible DNA-binding protein